MKFPFILLTTLSILAPMISGNGARTSDGDDEYPSAEKEKYYKERNFHQVRPTIPDILSFRPEHCIITEIEDYSPYDDSLIVMTPYAYEMMQKMMERFNSGHFEYNPWLNETIGKVPKASIIKHEQRGTFEAFIYTDSTYSDLYSDLWIAVSNDSGENWEYYFTGLTEQQPVYPKWYSKLPLIVDENTLRIEAALMQQTGTFMHPMPMGKMFEMIKDGVVITFDLQRLKKDSDGDGLTDLVEYRLRTNPFNSDTNGNGIPDNIDPNPRYDLPPTELTQIYEVFLDEAFAPYDEEQFEIEMQAIASGEKRNNPYEWADIKPVSDRVLCISDQAQTVLIVTDDENLKAVRPRYARTIILSSEEYEATRNSVFEVELCQITLTPFFKVDNHSNLFIVEYSYKTSGWTYLLEKTGDGWRRKMISMWIS